MTYKRNRRPWESAGSVEAAATTTATVTDPADDVYAWSAVFLTDGRVISIAWLRGYPGAIAARWRRWR